MNIRLLRGNILELIRRTSAYLPVDVDHMIQAGRVREAAGTKAAFALDLVRQNIGLARSKSLPICQDTGTISFFIHTPVGVDQIQMAAAIREAVVEATSAGYLRQNSVDSITGKNSGNNLGPESPVFHWEQTNEPQIDVRLILKGGGCENMSAQYSLPTELHGRYANRNLDGVRACVLDSVWRAQGKGCGPGFLGICIGGDRATGYDFAKRQLLRLADDVNPDPRLAELENSILEQANTLDIGPMGFAGRFTIGGCKVGAINRLPASFFVSIAYMCWAYRRRGFVLDLDGNIEQWLYQEPNEDFSTAEVDDESMSIPGGEVVRMTAPLSEQDVRKLKAGDVVLLSGVVHTARDAVHKYLFEGNDLPSIQNGIIYHCGPVVIEGPEGHRIVAAGPTTSIREEPYQADIIRRFGIRAVIGKGGMGNKTRAACQQYGCVYLHAIGGAAQVYARCVEKVLGVSLEQFGSPEAVWELQVKDLPAIVTIDSHGCSLHEEVAQHSQELLAGV